MSSVESGTLVSVSTDLRPGGRGTNLDEAHVPVHITPHGL